MKVNRVLWNFIAILSVYLPIFGLLRSLTLFDIAFTINFLFILFKQGIKVSWIFLMLSLCSIQIISFLIINLIDFNTNLESFAIGLFRTVQVGALVYMLSQLKNKDLKKIKKYIFMAFSLSLSIGLILLIFTPEFVTLYDRYSGVYGNPNDLGAIIVICQPLIAYYLLTTSTSSNNIIYFLSIGSLILSIVSILLSGSFGYLSAFTLEWSIIIIFTLRKISYKNFIFIFGTFATIILLFYYPSDQYLVQVNNIDASSLVSRGIERATIFIDTIKLGLSQNSWNFSKFGTQDIRSYLQNLLLLKMANYPHSIIIGFGTGQTQYLLDSGFLVATAHNMFLVVLAEYGVIGIILFGVTIFISTGNRLPNLNLRYVWFYLVIISFALAASFTPMLYRPHFVLPLIVEISLGFKRAY